MTRPPYHLSKNSQVGECKVLLPWTRQWGLVVKSWELGIERDSWASGTLFLCLSLHRIHYNIVMEFTSQLSSQPWHSSAGS